MQKLTYMRWARALAIVGVYLLALQSMALTRIFSPADSSCCCQARAAECRCPVCEHNRDRASGQPLLSHCPDLSPEPFVAQPDLALPIALLQPLEKNRQQLPRLPPPQSKPAPNLEVPTPPPLA